MNNFALNYEKILEILKINFISLILISLMFSLFTSYKSKSQSEKDKAVIEYAKANGFSIKSNDVKNADPAILFCYSNHLYKEGQEYEAVFWYYVAQYRYRILLSCSIPGKAGYIEKEQVNKMYKYFDSYNKEMLDYIPVMHEVYRIELYEIIQKELAKKINGYHYKNLEKLKSMIDQVLQYEEKYPFDPMKLSPKPVLKGPIWWWRNRLK